MILRKRTACCVNRFTDCKDTTTTAVASHATNTKQQGPFWLHAPDPCAEAARLEELVLPEVGVLLVGRWALKPKALWLECFRVIPDRTRVMDVVDRDHDILPDRHSIPACRANRTGSAWHESDKKPRIPEPVMPSAQGSLLDGAIHSP